jgi:hypothetical protein
MRTVHLPVILFNSGSAVTAPVNTVAPAISGTATIGQTLSVSDGTWTGTAPITYTYQWKRDGVNIGSATNSTYQLVDADFGAEITCTVTATNTVTNTSATSAATSRVQETPAQTLGAELLTNGNFASWTTDNPDSWSITGEVASDPMITQVAPGGGAGTGAARIVSSATAAQPAMSQSVMVAGSYYEFSLNIDTRVSGSVRMFDVTNATLGFIGSSTGIKRVIGRAVSATVRIRGETTPVDVTVDDASVKLLTLNPQLTAPSANMRLDLFYTLPVSPVQGDQVWVLPRISDFSSGNYWLALLEYTGTQWNVTLFSVASHTRTSHTSAGNIGTTNGIRINCNGDTLKLYTTANSGGLWTQHGSDVTNSTYNTATSVNALWVSTITPGNLVYAPAD